jgi:general secretion pathway protein B
MSFILEALRRAEAERQRGAVPGLHAQPGVAAPLQAAPESGRGLSPVLVGMGALALLLAGAGLAWWAPWHADAVPAVAVTPAALPPMAVAPAAPVVVVPTLPSSPPVAAVAPRPGKASAGGESPLSAPALAPAPAAANLASKSALAARPSPPSSAVLPTVTLPAAAPSAPARVPLLAELPEAQRRELSALAMGGAMYADQPALRMVIINGQVFHEGDKPTPDLQVLQIRLKSVVFSLRGQRFEMPL